MLSLNVKLILLTLLVIFLDSRNLLRPIKREVVTISMPLELSFKSIGQNISSEFKFWSDFFSLRDENNRLILKVEDLEGKLVNLKDVGRENELLREQLKLKSAGETGRLVLGNIVGRLTERPTVVFINAGSNIGVRKGNLVIYKNFIVGKILSTTEVASRVQLLTDPEAFFDGTDIDSRNAKGEVRGAFATSLRMEKILPTEKINTGDTIVESTSGFILGKVVRVENSGSEILKSADLTVPYELERIEKVFILL